MISRRNFENLSMNVPLILNEKDFDRWFQDLSLNQYRKIIFSKIFFALCIFSMVISNAQETTNSTLIIPASDFLYEVPKGNYITDAET